MAFPPITMSRVGGAALHGMLQTRPPCCFPAGVYALMMAVARLCGNKLMVVPESTSM